MKTVPLPMPQYVTNYCNYVWYSVLLLETGTVWSELANEGKVELPAAVKFHEAQLGIVKFWNRHTQTNNTQEVCIEHIPCTLSSV